MFVVFVFRDAAFAYFARGLTKTSRKLSNILNKESNCAPIADSTGVMLSKYFRCVIRMYMPSTKIAGQIKSRFEC